MLSNHCDWFRDGHVNQAQPMEIFHEVFAGALGHKDSFHTGIAKLVRCGPELGTAISATTRREPPREGSCVDPSCLILICSLSLAELQGCEGLICPAGEDG